MLVTADSLLEWLEEKIKEGALIELTQNSDSFTIVLLNFKMLVLEQAKAFEGTTLLLAIKAAMESEIR